jgi:hypothetical protein
MNNRVDSPGKPSALDTLRDELGDEFTRVAARERAPLRRKLSGRRRVFALGVALLLLPASFAVAEGLEGEPSTLTFQDLQAFDEAGLSWDGENIRREGEVVACPVDDALREELGFDPCEIVPLAPAPAPLNEGEGSAGADLNSDGLVTPEEAEAVLTPAEVDQLRRARAEQPGAHSRSSDRAIPE